jgi:hypothetical protein
MSSQIKSFVIHKSEVKYALINYEEILDYYQLPFYKKWFNKCPVKKFIEIKND